MSQFYGDSIFWIEVEKIKPNPYQPRREFDEARLKDLADSIRMYGVLQPLVVTRREVEKEDGGLSSEYELISGERRLRASKLAGIKEVPAIIRQDTDDSRLKLELAIIENLQREDLNPVDRARAFKQLQVEFKFKPGQIAERIGRSREYVANTIRILDLPEEILKAVEEGKISEGHTRPILMLTDRPEEQMTLFKDVVLKKLTVREAEHIARNIAVERVRRKDTLINSDLYDMEAKMSELLGTRVRIEQKGSDGAGRVQIDFFSRDDLKMLLTLIDKNKVMPSHRPPVVASAPDEILPHVPDAPVSDAPASPIEPAPPVHAAQTVPASAEVEPIDDRSKEDKQEDEAELYSIKNFSL